MKNKNIILIAGLVLVLLVGAYLLFGDNLKDTQKASTPNGGLDTLKDQLPENPSQEATD
ncbi:MAG: SpoIIIAH-like family protein [Tissierellia bacterium]|nr:SpoIIIAH-like family protein [Tissierellia bacterium]